MLTILFLFEKSTLSDSTKCCPPNEQIFPNFTCTDDTYVNLTCKIKARVLENKNHLSINVSKSGVLSLTEEAGVLQIDPLKYCLGVDYENESYVVLICMEEPDTEGEIGLRVLSYIRILCSLTSVVFFISIAVIYICMPELRDIEGKCIINFAITFGISHFLQAIGPIIAFYYPHTCDAFSFTNNFAVLSSYNWLTVMSVHIWRITIRPIFHTQMNWFLIYLLYGYGFPIILFITSLISHLTKPSEFFSQFEESFCWLDGSTIVWFYFYGPIAVLVFISTVIQLWAAKKLWIDIDRRDRSNSVVRLRKKCLMYLHLLLVSGSMVIMELAVYPLLTSDNIPIVYTLTLLDCRGLLIGGAVFFIFVVLRNKVLRALAKNGLCCLEFPSKWKKLIDEEEELDREPETEETTLTGYNA